jgi:hypothetical protein
MGYQKRTVDREHGREGYQLDWSSLTPQDMVGTLLLTNALLGRSWRC